LKGNILRPFVKYREYPACGRYSQPYSAGGSEALSSPVLQPVVDAEVGSLLVVTAAYHAHQQLLRPLPESCVLMVLGIVVGLLLYAADAGGRSDRHQLDSGTFFFVLLPPIIIDAGYFMPTRAFFDQLGTIVLYAAIGTLVHGRFTTRSNPT